MIGAASGSGFLAALIALPPSGKAACLIKTIASMLGVSVLLFCLAVFCYLRWLVGVQNARMDAQSTAQTTTLDEAQNEFAKKVLRENVWFTRLIGFAIGSLVLVLVSVVLAIWAIERHKVGAAVAH
jgi:hypothetical protein